MILDVAAPEYQKEPQASGRWQNIRWKPNESTGEIVNIGVILRGADGRIHTKFVESFDRLKCMYDQNLASQAKFLIRVTQDALMVGADIPSNNVFLSDPKYASGDSASSILAALFDATVPLGAARRGTDQGPKPVMLPADTVTVRRQVLDALREIAGVNADKIISSESAMEVRTEGRTHYLDIPLQVPSALGTIVAAGTARPTDELQLLRADADLHVARRVYSRDRLFMYVVRSDQETNADKVDSFLEELHWKFQQVGVQMKSYTEPGLAARDIIEDMPVS